MIISGRYIEENYDYLDDPDAGLFLALTPEISNTMRLARSTPDYGGSITGVSAKYAKVPYDEQLTERNVDQLHITLSSRVLGGITSMLKDKCNLGSIFSDGVLVAFDNGGGRERPRMRIINDYSKTNLQPTVDDPEVTVQLIIGILTVSGYAHEDVWASMSEEEIRSTMSLRSLSFIASAALEFAKRALASAEQN